MSITILPVAVAVFLAMAVSALLAPAGLGQPLPGVAEPVEPPSPPVAESPPPQESRTPATPPRPERPGRSAEAGRADELRPAGEPAPRPVVADTPVNLDFEEEVLDDRIAFIQKRLTETGSRLESLLMTLELEVLSVQKDTLARRRELESVRAELSGQERLTAQDLRNKERLVDLVDRYGAGDWVARHIKVELEKFRHRGQGGAPASADEASFRARLREYRQTLFELGTRLFRADSDARSYARALAAEGQPSAAVNARLGELVEDRKEALRSQERVLNELADRASRLAELKREREDQLESLYTFVLDKMLWLRNREPVGLFPPNWAFFGQAVDGGAALLGRLNGFLRLEGQLAQIRFAASLWPWAAAVLVFGLLPLVAARAGRFVKERLTDHRARGQAVPAHRVALLLAVRAAVWPGYIIVLTLALPELGFSGNDSLGPVLAGALQLVALVLWAAMFGEEVFRPDGHGERRWELTPQAGRVLRTAVVTVAAAALLLLVPRFVVLNAPGDDVAASLALGRLLMLAFALVVLVLAAAGCGRRGALMQSVLRHSRSQEGFLWSVWPLVHLLAVAVLAGIIVLNLAGYQYAAQYAWQRIMGSGVLVLAVLLLSFYVNSAARTVWRRVAGVRGGAAVETGDGGAVLRVLVDLPLWIVGAALLLEVWGVSVVEFMGTPAGETVMARAALIALVIIAGLGLVRLSNAAVLSLLRPRILDRVRSREAGRKLQTLAPLAQTSVKLLVVLVGALLILQLVGVETGPLLAGVGIFGLAVGFAAQSLIKDVINGLFILTEGSVGAGDVVDVGGVTGVVEKVTLRSVRIRDLSGNVHFVPNSTIEHVENMTKDYSRYLLDVGVGYREDTDEVVAVMKEVDESMRADPQFRRDMLEPIEIMGVDRFEDSAVIVRARLKTRPVQQWRIGREYNRRLKKAFDERGIEIPFPHRTVYWGETKQGQIPLQVDDRRRETVSEPGVPEAENREPKEEEETLGTKQLKTEP